MAERARTFHPLLARLEFRRALGGTALLILGVAVLLVTRDWTSDWTLGLGSDGTPGSASIGTHGLARRAVWSGVLLLLLPLATLHAASLPHRWRAGEADWLGSRPVGRAPALASVLAGMLAASALLLVATVTIVELGIGVPATSCETLRLEWSRNRRETIALAPGEFLEFTLQDVPAGALLSLRLMPTYGADPTTDARLTLTRAETHDTAETHDAAQTHDTAQLRIATRATLEARVPEGTGVLEVRLTNAGGGSLAWLAENGLELWRPAGSAHHASLALASRAFLALVPLLALALGTAFFVGPWTASLGSLCIYLTSVALPHAPAWYPGADLLRALDVVSLGRLPGAISPVSWLLAALLVALGLGLGTLGLRSWRHTP
ncbi:MAG: hypothetical protein V3T22_01510 [Planctomycetota bacterium]